MAKREPNPGAWLRASRAAAHLSREELAKETGLTLRDIERIEQNDLRMGSSKYVAIADYFDVMLEEILYSYGEEVRE